MKKITIVLSIVISIFIIACNSENNSKTDDNTIVQKTDYGSIIGSWKISKAEGTLSDANIGMLYVFMDNGNMVYGTDSAKYIVNNDEIIITINNMFDINYKYTIIENILSLKAVKSTQVFYLEKN